MKNKVDVIIFSGQSNMVGESEGLPLSNETDPHIMEYRFSSNQLTILKHPIGEDLFDGALEGSVKGGGSLVFEFCKSYFSITGSRVVAVHAACGSTTIADWMFGTMREYWAKTKINSAFKKVKEKFAIRHVYFVWLQGESDALIKTSEEEYLRKLITLKEQVKREFGVEKFCIIKVGYFVSEVSWVSGKKDELVRADESIMHAQERAVKEDKDFIMLSRICCELSKNRDYINPNEEGHYNNKALDLIGKESGMALAELSVCC